MQKRIQYLFKIKTSNKPGIKGNFHNLIRVLQKKKPHSKRLDIFLSKIKNKTKMSTLAPLFNIVIKVPARVISSPNQKKKKSILLEMKM